MTDDRIKLTDKELLYAATARCRCGVGLAYPLDHDLAMALGAWVCSAVLRGDVAGVATDQTQTAFTGAARAGDHDCLPWAYFKIREETSINNRGGHTTRPAGTVARTIGKAKCPKCDHEWQSEPYSACALSHHWFSGPCPKCGYAVGSGGVYRSDEGEPIKVGCPHVVLDAERSVVRVIVDGRPIDCACSPVAVSELLAAIGLDGTYDIKRRSGDIHGHAPDPRRYRAGEQIDVIDGEELHAINEVTPCPA